MVSFDSPQKNLEVYRFVNDLKPLQEFFEIERSKLLQKYGCDNGDNTYTVKGQDNISNYQKDVHQLLDLEIDENIFIPNISLEDFSGNCSSYPEDKNLWMNAHDIESVFNFIEKYRAKGKKE